MSGRVLQFDLTQEDRALRARAETTRAGRAAKTLVKDGPLRITQIALVRGAALSPHAVAAAVSVQVLRGRLLFDVDGRKIQLRAGGLITLEADTLHAARALSDASLVLTAAMPS